jgi:hypothetical protein
LIKQAQYTIYTNNIQRILQRIQSKDFFINLFAKKESEQKIQKQKPENSPRKQPQKQKCRGGGICHPLCAKPDRIPYGRA